MIGLLLIATGKYDCFLQQILDSANEHFMQGFDVTAYVFTDKTNLDLKSGRIQIRRLEVEHKPFPYATLYRYRHFMRYEAVLRESDYLFYSDVDMRFVDSVGVEIIPNESGLTVVQHPGYWKGGWGSPNNSRQSTSYLPPSLRKHYFCGGFNGGTSEAFLKMASELEYNITMDERRGVMAEYHDETHLNHYLAIRKPHVLTPSMCFPETWEMPFKKKLLALDKDHNAMRY